MTNKEAIEQIICIKRIKEDFHSPVNKHDIEALELAIKALEFIDENFPKTFIDYLNGEQI